MIKKNIRPVFSIIMEDNMGICMKKIFILKKKKIHTLIKIISYLLIIQIRYQIRKIMSLISMI